MSAASLLDKDRTKPYSFWFHPYVSFTEMFIQILVLIQIPLYILPRYSAIEPRDELKTKLKNIRDSLRSSFDSPARSDILKWSKAFSGDCEIIQFKFSIPARRDILQDWGIVSEKDKEKVMASSNNDKYNPPPPTVELMLHFPANLLTKDSKDLSEARTKDSKDLSEARTRGANKNGTISVQNLDLANFFQENRTVPVVVYYHGGGFTVCTYEEPTGLALAIQPSIQTGQPLILVSAEYAISPEYHFPVAVEDSLTAIEFIRSLMSGPPHQNQVEKIPLHILGISAGCQFASVVTMECHRRFPGLIKSSVLISPMLDPAADSVSFYLNSKSSWFITVGWLRWCWQAFLEMPKQRNAVNHKNKNNMEELRKVDSNQSAWAASKWRGTSYERLINPILDLPTKDLNDDHVAPSILVATQEGDPLRDDGCALVQALQNERKMSESKLKHIHTAGSHVFGLMFDKNAMSTLASWWSEIIFPASTNTTKSS